MTDQVLDVKLLEKNIDEIVDQLIIKSGADEQINTICETFVEKHKLGGKEATELKSYLKEMGKKRYDMIYASEKYEKAKKKANEVYSTLENLFEKE